MAELVYQTWERVTGRPWSEAHSGGFTDGSYQANVDLQKRLLGGWDPYAPAKKALTKAAPKPAPKPAAKAAAAPSPTPSVPMQIEPGAYLALQEEILELQRQEQEATDARDKERIAIERERLEQVAREMELRLSLSPIDFVAYEMYKREREEAGKKTYTGAARTDEDIQAMVQAFYGGGEGVEAPRARKPVVGTRATLPPRVSSIGRGQGTLGVGAFGADIPRTEAISRAEFLKLSPDEMDILGSFLRAGFTPTGGGEEVSYDPVDYWREVEQGFIPTIQTPAMARYAF